MSLRERLSSSEWLVEESDFDLTTHNVYETLFTVGNGYQGTRGSLEESVKGECSGTFLAGVFDAHDASVIELVNAPSWLPLTIWVEGERLNMQTCKALEHRRILDMRTGVLYRHTLFEDPRGRRTRYESMRYASSADPHLCGIRARVTPENYGGVITVESGIDGERYNLDRLPVYPDKPVFHPEVKWKKWSHSKHLQHIVGTVQESRVYLEMETLDTGHRLGYAGSLDVIGVQAHTEYRLDYEKVSQSLSFEVQQGSTYTLDKLVSIFTSRDVHQGGIRNACLESLKAGENQGFEARLDEHGRLWAQKWSDCDCVIEGDARATQALRFSIYHLLIAANAADSKINVGANGLSGERYRGHVFWDTEVFLLPFYIYTQPQTARSLLAYRYHTLPGAIQNAAANGFQGAQYAWESADTGLETTPEWTQDGAHRLWMGDEEIHISADVAYGVLSYLTATEDWTFFVDQGAEIVFRTACFWESRLEYNKTHDRYELSRVMGPDEFHEHLDNNVYTNWMTKWHLQKAVEWYAWLKTYRPDVFASIAEQLTLDDARTTRWQAMADKIHIPSNREGKLIEAFDGYFQLKEEPITDWDDNGMPAYPSGYHHFNAGETTLVKQPDVVMLLYVLPDEFDDQVKSANYAFYEQRTLHKSSLSPGIHSIMGIEVGDTEKAVQYFMRSALTDLANNQGNTEWGMHIAAAGATWQCAVCGFGGLRVKNQRLTFKPWLPEGWKALRYRVKWRGDTLSVTVYPDKAVFFLDSEQTRTESIEVFKRTVPIHSGQEKTVFFSAPEE